MAHLKHAANPVDPLWPTLGSVWSTAEDCLLACKLAALREGFSHIFLHFDASAPLQRWIKSITCASGLGWVPLQRSMLNLLKLVMVHPTEEHLGFKIVEMRDGFLSAARHGTQYDVSSALVVSALLRLFPRRLVSERRLPSSRWRNCISRSAMSSKDGTRCMPSKHACLSRREER